MKFGDWKITEGAILWDGQELNRFVIDKETLLDTIAGEPGYGDLYKWIVLATAEDWITDDDLYDLNNAFIYAAGYWQQNFNYDLFENTVEYQYDLLDDEETDNT